jgi:hypothetical protein
MAGLWLMTSTGWEQRNKDLADIKMKHDFVDL